MNTNEILLLQEVPLTLVSVSFLVYFVLQLWRVIGAPTIKRREDIQSKISDNSRRIDIIEKRVGSLEETNRKEHKNMSDDMNKGFNKIYNGIDSLRESVDNTNQKIIDLDKQVLVIQTEWKHRECQHNK